MTQSPLVSVIVLTYNQQGSIAATLDSILSQRHDEFDLEVVIGEDASTDGTRAVCESYVRRYPSQVRLMPAASNKGVVRNYFDCLAACRGWYIADCPGDDVWPSADSLQALVGTLHSRPDLSAVAGSVEIVDEKGRLMDVSRPPEHLTVANLLAADSLLPVVLSAMLYRRGIIARILDREPAAVCNPDWMMEDVPVIAALADAGQIARVDTVALRYVVGDSVSHERDAARDAAFTLAALQCRLFMAERYGVPLKQLRPMFARKLSYAMTMAFRSGRTGLCETAMKLFAATSTPVSLRDRALAAVMSHRGVWRMLRAVWLRLRP